MGDLSENAAYKAARMELSAIDRQIRRLTYLLRYGVIVEKHGSAEVDFGSRVTLDNGKTKMTFDLVGGYESDPKQEKLSVFSPIGKAILHKHVGDAVTVHAPVGEINYTIVEIN
jgi:transcription elongation factor GreA